MCARARVRACACVRVYVCARACVCVRACSRKFILTVFVLCFGLCAPVWRAHFSYYYYHHHHHRRRRRRRHYHHQYCMKVTLSVLLTAYPSGSVTVSLAVSCEEKTKQKTEHVNTVSETERGPELSREENQHTREVISARKTSHKYNNKDLNHLR